MVISEPPVSENEKREALDAVLASATFARSAQLKAFLRYICEQEMAGHSESLTEYQIAVAVLGRRKDFSLSDDSSVRNRAYELRQRIDRYYAQEHPSAAIRIAIPRGGYIPYYARYQPPVEDIAITVPQPPPALPTPLQGSRSFGWKTLAAIGILCVAAGALSDRLLNQSHPAAVVREAWGPLAEPGDNLLICIATNLHMIVPAAHFTAPLALPGP